jgi:hypothetical protein
MRGLTDFAKLTEGCDSRCREALAGTPVLSSLPGGPARRIRSNALQRESLRRDVTGFNPAQRT